MTRILAVVLAGAAVAVLVGWAVVSRLASRGEPGPQPAESRTPSEDLGRRIRVMLYYVSEDGMRLASVEREIAYAPTALEQARIILTEQLSPAPDPYAQAIPPGTTLRAVFLTPEGDAYVDLSKEATSGHPGGSLDEAFSVYAVVNALTVNLPAINRVQILVEGREVDTLAGHIDLRQPLRKDLRWLEAPSVSTAAPSPGVPPIR